MSKVAAVIDLQIDPSYFSEIKYTFVDNRYVNYTNKGYYGINALAT
jgi:hypothetical protein